MQPKEKTGCAGKTVKRTINQQSINLLTGCDW